MNDTLKFIWVGLIIFCIIGLLVSVPVENTQLKLRKAIMKKHLAPQARLDATQKYFELYENGQITDIYSFGESPELKKLYDIELEKKVSQQTKTGQPSSIRQPLYIRDKKNPNILYKYTYEGEYQTASSIKKFPYKKVENFNSNIRRPLYLRDRNNPNSFHPLYP